VAESLVLQVAERSPQRLGVLAGHVRSEGPIGPSLVALVAELVGKVQDDRHREAVVLPRERDDGLARLRLHVRGVDDRDLAGGETLLRDEIEHVEGVVGRGLAVLVVRDEAAAIVRGDDFGWLEVLSREGRLARARRPDHGHDRQLGDRDLHARRVKTAICVGEPTSGSLGPIGARRKP
jgi:hypothetical protein